MANPEQNQRILTVLAEPNGAVRTETLMGRTYRVVPAVLVKSQVLNNNLGATYLPPEEITPDWADAWNGAVVVAGDHPSRGGFPISARQPEILDRRGVGNLFATQAQEDDQSRERRLTAEVWLEEARAEAVPELKTILQRLDAGNAVELSTGFPCIAVNQTGEHNGEHYDFVMRPIGVDHLAVSSEFTGACSVADGCGLGVNESAETAEEDAATADGAIAAARAPVATEGEEAMGEEQEGAVAAAEPAPEAANTKTRWERFRAFLGFAAKEEGQVVLNLAGESVDEYERRVRGALEAKLTPGTENYVAILGIYPEERQVIYYLSTPNGPDPLGDEFYKIGFEERTDGEVSFDQNPVRVRRRVTFEPVQDAGNSSAGETTGNEEVNMDRQAVIAQLAAVGPLTVEDLGKLSDCQLGALAGVNAAAAAHAEAATNTEEPVADTTQTGVTVEQLDELRSVVTAQGETIKAQAATIESLQAAAAPAVAEQERQRTALIDELAGNTRVTAAYSREELAAMSAEQLNKVRALARGESYVGQGGPRVEAQQSTTDAPQFAEPVPYWAKPAESEK